MNIILSSILWVTYVISLYFSIFLVLVYIDKKSFFDEEKSNTNPPKYPFVSVLIPGYNEEKTILKTLESVNNIDYPIDKLEVIVINDGSTDKTEEIVKEYIKDKSHFKLMSHENMGKAASMNKAVKIAKGEFFACLDADSFVDSLTLRKMLSFYYKENDPQLAIVTPAMKVYKPKNVLQKIQRLEYLVMILIARLTSHLDSLYVAPGPFSIYRTDILKKIGGFDEKNITEDQEIAYRAQRHHYKIKQCFDGYVYTTAPSKLKPFYKQRRRWYLGSVVCLQKYKNLIGNKKYGDFGLMQMTKSVAGYFLAMTGIIIAVYLFIKPLITQIRNLYIIGFDIMPYIRNFEIKFNFLSFLMADFKLGFLVVFIFMVGFYLFYKAHKNANEKVREYGILSLIPYFAFYYLLKGVILLLTLIHFARGKKIKW